MVPDFGASPLAFLATALRVDEIAHGKYLRAALGSAIVKKPAINLNALGYGFSSVHSWLTLARQFEDVGVSAYLGAAPLIKNKTYLAAAGEILATEAQHSGSIRMARINDGVSSPAVDSLDVPPTQQAPYDVDKNALSIPRTTSQVLNIVYHGGQCSGGFYPQGMNGKISCQS
jgi:Ferritin-like domain